jgi:4-amino-4-deoxy-L-arabinose transferase-like glycosyltransferase
MTFINNHKWLLMILLVAIIFRLINLQKVPSGFHYDEAQSGYNGWLIANHLTNIHGQKWPTDIDYYGDFRPAVHSYLTALPIKIFGLNEFATRLPSALAGAITVWLIYLLAKEIFNDKKVALVAALFLSISPFHVVFSRGATDGIVEMMFVVAGFVALLKFWKQEKIWWLLITYLSWFMAFFTYPTSRLLVPIFTLIIIGCLWLSNKTRRRLLVPIVILLVIYLIFPWGISFMSGKGAGRFKQVSVFSFPEVQRSLNQTITESGSAGINPLIVRIFANKIWAYGRDITYRQLSFFSSNVVLFDTTQPKWYQIPSMGLITAWEYIGLLFGVYFLVRKKERALAWFPLLSMLVAPLPSAVTFDAFPNFQRAIYLIPFWQIVAAFGWWGFYQTLKKRYQKVFLGGMAIIVLFFVGLFIYEYFYIAPYHEPFHRFYEQKEMAFYVNNEGKKYGSIGLSSWNNPYIFYLFFNHLDVFDQKVIKPGKYFLGDFQINNLQFYEDKCWKIPRFPDGFNMIVELEECHKYSFMTPVHEFRRKDGSLAAIAYIIDQQKFKTWKLTHPNLMEN